MAHRFALVILALFILAAPSTLAREEGSVEAAKLFSKGEALLRQGDLDSAFKAFAAAAKGDPENPEYAAQAMLVRRVQALRKHVDTTEPSPTWEKTVLALHAFYLTHKVHGEALSLNRLAHKKLNSALSASLLAETLLEMDRDKEALALLEGLDTKKRDRQNTIYLGIALARLGRVEEAGKIAGECPVTSEESTGVLYDVARMNALLGNQNNAFLLLTHCLERTPPSQIEMVRGLVKGCRDFKPLMGTAGFEAVLKTASKVVESGCSSGASCSTCPSKTKCSEETKTEDGKAKEDCGGCEKK